MPLFKREGNKLISHKATNFKLEKELQALIEENLEVVFNSRLVAREFSTGAEHAGRIDTLALSEDGNPVIIEYKKVQSSELVTQSLYYLSWLNDHRGDFQVAVERVLGNGIEIDWDSIRVICIAPNYSKFDLHAVKVMGANIELWQYKLYQDDLIYFEEIFRKSSGLLNAPIGEGKNPVMVAAGKKAAITRATAVYSFDEHLKKAEANIGELLEDLREYVTSLDESVKESPKKYYVAYKVAKNFVCIEIQKRKLLLTLKFNPKEIDELPKGARDVSGIGRLGDLEYTLKSKAHLEIAKKLIRRAFDEVGG